MSFKNILPSLSSYGLFNNKAFISKYKHGDSVAETRFKFFAHLD